MLGPFFADFFACLFSLGQFDFISNNFYYDCKAVICPLSGIYAWLPPPSPLSLSLYFAFMKQTSFTLKFRGLFILLYYLNLVFLSDYKLFFRKFLTVLESLWRKMTWRGMTLKKIVIGKKCLTNRTRGSLQAFRSLCFFLSFIFPELFYLFDSIWAVRSYAVPIKIMSVTYVMFCFCKISLHLATWMHCPYILQQAGAFRIFTMLM